MIDVHIGENASGLADLLHTISEILGGFGTLFVGIAAIIAILRGLSAYEKTQIRIEEQKISLAEHELARKFKFEVALRSLKAVHELRRAILRIRSPWGTNEEREEDKKRRDGMAPGAPFKEVKDPIGSIALLRIEKERDKIQTVDELRPEFRVVFGTDAPLADLLSIISKIDGGATSLVFGTDTPGEKKDALYLVYLIQANDPLHTQMQSAIATIEQKCAPILSGFGSKQ